jgi:hypothetical protein
MRKTYVCNLNCEATLGIPDARDQFDKIAKQASAKAKDSAFPCDSPDQNAEDGKRCGRRSAFAKEGGRIGFE